MRSARPRPPRPLRLTSSAGRAALRERRPPRPRLVRAPLRRPSAAAGAAAAAMGARANCAWGSGRAQLDRFIQATEDT